MEQLMPQFKIKKEPDGNENLPDNTGASHEHPTLENLDSEMMDYEFVKKNMPLIAREISKKEYLAMTDDEFALRVGELRLKTENTNLGRRSFLKAATGAALTTIIPSSSSQKSEGVPFAPYEEEFAYLTPREQIEHKEFLNLEDAYRGRFIHYYNKILNTNTKQSLTGGIDRIHELDYMRLHESFKRTNHPSMAHLLMLKESWAINETARHGTKDAKGQYQIRPSTANLFVGVDELDLPEKYRNVGRDVYQDADLASHILTYDMKTLRTNDINLGLYAYNAGAGLFGYNTKERKDREQLTPEGFREYMENWMNETLEIFDRDGEITIDTTKRQYRNLSYLKEKRFTDRETLIKIVFAKAFETLNYVPDLYAISAAMKKLHLSPNNNNA